MNIIAVIILLLGLPLSSFFCMKFGRYGYLRAGELFEEQRKKRQQPSN